VKWICSLFLGLGHLAIGREDDDFGSEVWKTLNTWLFLPHQVAATNPTIQDHNKDLIIISQPLIIILLIHKGCDFSKIPLSGAAVFISSLTLTQIASNQSTNPLP
jgi:hypothetical protein